VEFALVSAAHRFGSLHRFGDALQRGARFGQENATSFCEPDGFGIVLEQRQLEFLLKVEDLSAQARLRNVQPCGGARDVFFFRDSHEVSQVPEFHVGASIAARHEEQRSKVFSLPRDISQSIVNAMDDKNFAAAVKATGRKKLIIGGVTNDVCTVYPALSLVREGFEVQVVADAGGSPTKMSDDISLRRMERGEVTLTTTNQLIAELAGSWTTPEGGQLVRGLMSALQG